MPENKPPLNFNPAAAILIDKATFTIALDTRTGLMEFSTNRPDMNFLAVLDLLATQIQNICRNALAQQAKGHPGFVAPGAGENPGGNSGGKDGAS